MEARIPTNKFSSAKKPNSSSKSKTYKKPWTPNFSIRKAKEDADKQYKQTMAKTMERINDEKNKAQAKAEAKIEGMKTTAIKTANEVKYSSPKIFMLAKAAESTMKKAQPQLNQLKTDSSHFYNETFGEQKALFAAEISNKGVPQSNPEVVGPNLLATTMHRK